MLEDEISTGTTLLVFKYKNGLMLAADSRTSSGIYVASRITDKLNQITDNIFLCRSGSASDSQLILRIVKREIKKISLIEGNRPSVKKTAQLISKIIYENKEYVKAAIIVAGYDDSPKIFKINICGSIQEEKDIFLGGSGGAFISGYCDYYFVPDMNLDQSLDFAKSAIRLAIKNDMFSGGLARIAALSSDSIQRYVLSGEHILEK